MKPPARVRRGLAKPAEPPAAFVLSCIDLPRPGARLHPGGVLSGKGWAISSSPIASIAVHLGELFLCYASYGQPRPEVGRDFSHYPQAHHSGFVFSVPLGPEIEPVRGADLEFRFRTEQGGETRRHLRLAWDKPGTAGTASDVSDDSVNRPWPIRIALEECRIDPAGRLRLRGFVVSREALTSLELFLNETSLQVPERGLDRPDIAQRHPSYPGAGQSGFRLVQYLGTPAEARDTVRVVARAGGVQRQIIVPLTPPDGSRRLLQAETVTLCCEALRLSADGTLVITGWAVGADETRAIEVLDGATSLGLADIGLPRPDIGNRFPRLPGSRFAGFRLRTQVSPITSGMLTLVVRDAAGDERRMALRLPGGAAAVAGEGAAHAETIHVGIDRPTVRGGRVTTPIRGQVSFAGWAVCASGIASVEVWADDSRLGDAYIGVRREDIAALHPDLADALTAGFALTVPHRLLGDGEHVIRIVIRSRAGDATEEVFRIVLEPDDDGSVGALRRVVPAAETALRQDLLARFGALPAFTLLIRRASAGEAHGLAATLETLRRQSLSAWRAVVLVHDEAEESAACSVIAADPALAARVNTRLVTGAEPIWDEPADEGFELLCVMRAGDRFGADALIELALAARGAAADFVYADERCFDPGRESVRPFLKPGWSPDLLLATNYIGRAWCATRACAERAGFSVAALDRFGEHDAVLRLTEVAARVVHLPLSLAERLGRRIETPLREQEAVQRAATRRGIVGEVVPGRAPATWRLRRVLPPAPPPVPLVSVIIPTCGSRALVRNAITTLRDHAGEIPIEIVVLDDVPADQPALKQFLAAAADRVVAVCSPFNWSHANNLGARVARGTFLLFLNDDTVFIDAEALPALLEHAQRPEIGAVGPQLLYPDGKVQHAGMFLRGAEGLHAFRFADGDAPGPFGLALTTREVTAITGACMMVRRSVFEALGGFDESHGVIKNDLDFCLRLHAAGLRVLYTPYARLVHHEMASRAALPDQFDAARFDGAWGLRQLQGDSLLNPNLSPESEDFLAEIEPVHWVQPGHRLIDRAMVASILVMKLDHIGDFVSALPAIERLREAFPAARITLLGSPASVALAPLCPAIDDVVAFEVFAAREDARLRAIGEVEFEALAALLRPRHYDIAVDLRTHPDTRHVLRHTGATWLAGYDHGGRFGWLDIALEWEGDLRLADKRAHVSESLLRLASAVVDAARGAPGAALPGPEVMAATRRLLVGAGADAWFADRPLICLHPGAGTALKQWPPAAFAGLIRLLLAAHDVSVVLIGGAEETALVAEVAARVDRPDAVLSLAGRVGLAELPELLRGCALFVGNDSGPKHLAAALGVPTVGVHASHVDVAEWGPAGARAIGVQRRMSCGPCYIADESDCPRAVACLRGIPPAQVYRACRLLLGFTFGADSPPDPLPPAG